MGEANHTTNGCQARIIPKCGGYYVLQHGNRIVNDS